MSTRARRWLRSRLAGGKTGAVVGEVIGIDADPACLDYARANHSAANLSLRNGDALTEPLAAGSFDFIAAIATLHHLPLRHGLERLRELLSPGGVLAIVGLYRNVTAMDYAYAAVAMPVSIAVRVLKSEEPVGAPLQEPEQTLREIRAACESILPGAVVRRRLFFRFSVV